MGPVVISAAVNSTRRSAGRTGWRFFWALLFIGHAPAIFAVFSRLVDGPTFTDVTSALLLLATQSFFVFKIVNVRWLRAPASRGAILRFVIIAALLHAGVIERNWHAFDLDDAVPALVPTLWAALVSSIALFFIAALPVLRRRIRLAALRLQARNLIRDFQRWRAHQRLAPPERVLLARLLPDRAPPICG